MADIKIKISSEINLNSIKNTVKRYKECYGDKVCSEVTIEDGIASYEFMPYDVTGYTMQMDLVTGKTRHCGNGRGCYWTDWE